MTAIEFLIEELIESQYFPYGTPIILIKQAKEMEKQQIMDAANSENSVDINYGERYYNETFKNTKK